MSPNGIGHQSSKSTCVGSNPITPANRGVIAQLEEHLICIQAVESSILSDSTKHVGRIRSGRGAGL